jgi:transcriptional regulator with PAS, ATPase and Fis domain
MVYDALSRHQSGILSLDTFREHLEYCTGIPQNVSITAADITKCSAQKVQFFEQLPTLREVEDLLVQEALSRSTGNQSIAASLLGLTRSALNKRINKK